MEGHSLFLFHDYFLAVGNVDSFGGLVDGNPVKVVASHENSTPPVSSCPESNRYAK